MTKRCLNDKGTLADPYAVLRTRTSEKTESWFIALIKPGKHRDCRFPAIQHEVLAILAILIICIKKHRSWGSFIRGVDNHHMGRP
jgi:hypothetical protein